MSKFSETQIKEVAEYSWWRRTSKLWRETSKTELAAKYNLTEDQIEELRSTSKYHKYVEQLMLGQRTAKAFEKWIQKDDEMPKRFAEHMGIDPSVLPDMIERVRQAHRDIALGKMKAPPKIPNPNKKRRT